MTLLKGLQGLLNLITIVQEGLEGCHAVRRIKFIIAAAVRSQLAAWWV